jgi:ABC-type cobalamin/Fe3+-siderophores transport system ATPase subunit
MINITNLNLFIKKTPVLNDVTFTLHNNEILGITGPSGCGKSSLIKTLSGKIDSAGNMIEANGKR